MCALVTYSLDHMINASALNSLRYDMGTYQTDLRQSVGPGAYVLGTPTQHCSPCFAGDPRTTNGTSGVASCINGASLVDVDSDLHGLTRRATRCPTGFFQAGTQPACAIRGVNDCRSVAVEDTRLNNPPCTLRGTGWNRWEWLCRNPQERALLPFDTMVDTSIVVKDNHRPHVVRPLDQTLAMPPGKNAAAGQGAPDWKPRCEPEFLSPIPEVHWRTCSEMDRIQNGAR